LTRNEIRKMFTALTTQLQHAGFRLNWSLWRRHHQAVARACHFKRRPVRMAAYRDDYGHHQIRIPW
jgi:hypothetical protein